MKTFYWITRDGENLAEPFGRPSMQSAPISKVGKIVPASPVNIVGRIFSQGNIIDKVKDTTRVLIKQEQQEIIIHLLADLVLKVSGSTAIDIKLGRLRLTIL